MSKLNGTPSHSNTFYDVERVRARAPWKSVDAPGEKPLLSRAWVLKQRGASMATKYCWTLL